MNLRALLGEWGLARRFALGLLFANLILAAALTAAVLKIVGEHERIVLVPPHLDERAAVAWAGASEPYYKAFGAHIASLIGNLTPANVEFVLEVLSPLFDSRIYQSLRVKLLALKDDPAFARSQAVSYFTLRERLEYEPASRRVFVLGDLVTLATGGKPKKQSVVYEMQFETRNGVPLVVGWDSYEGSHPHTQKWAKAHPNTETGTADRAGSDPVAPTPAPVMPEPRSTHAPEVNNP